MALKLMWIPAVLLAFGVVGAMQYADEQAHKAEAYKHVVERPQDCQSPAADQKLIVFVVRLDDGVQYASCHLIPMDARERTWVEERIAAHREAQS